ncbi:MAG: 23S rRNA pseudouridine(1911/1915/1917) synthase RluD [Gammaproteobacteria bacterium]|nr:23S rRNA pseudouridine(1911/1915/1917) synthase RluD [Gammaproteobacteria bacterium]
MSNYISLSAEVPQNLVGSRLDQAAAKLFPDYSRSRLQSWIKDGSLKVNSKSMRPRDTLQSGDLLKIEAVLMDSEQYLPEPMELDILFEDEEILILNKPANIVVHPAPGNYRGTLLNGLLHEYPGLDSIPRAGIVHRLDKGTTGLMVVAKTLQSHGSLVGQLQRREVEREYEAVVHRVLTGGGVIDKPLGRHSVNRKKKAIVENGKEAITHYKVKHRYRSHTHIQLNLKTGRTHQIRVHMAHINHPLVGDPLYGGRLKLPVAGSGEFVNVLRTFRRQALHARRLAFSHPVSNEQMAWKVDAPADFQELLLALKQDQDFGGKGNDW